MTAYKPVFLINHKLLTLQIVIPALGGLGLGLGTAIWGVAYQHPAIAIAGMTLMFVLMIVAGGFSGNSGYLAMVVKENIAANVSAKYNTEVDLRDNELPEDMWSSLDKPRFYTFRSPGGVSKHLMHFLPSGEPVITVSSPIPTVQESIDN